MIGASLSHYRITAKLGAGGMGEVYRAKDENLGRDVAIKVLPEEVAKDAERLARFKREAHLLAALNHTNIASIYGLEEAHGKPFLVLELVEGEDLSERLKRGAIAVTEAIAIAKQIAEALEEAHEHGIVHRDLKPANVKLTPDGKVKVLDFGLAKAFGGDGGDGSKPELSHSPTMTRQGTVAGMILGTAAYMSPEQAKGKTVDRRADIWSFGVVLCEMLTGRRLFEAETVSEILAAVLRADIDLGSLPSDTPPRLRRLLTRCLDRDPKMRLRDIGEARVEIVKVEAGTPESGSSSVTAAPAPAPPTRRVAPLVIATAAGAIIATFGATRWLMPRAASMGGALAHLSVALPDGDEVGAINTQPLAVSEDGTRIAYVGLRDGKNLIYLRALGEPSPKALDGTEGGESPFFSPDGQWIAFFAGSKLRKIAVGGAALQALADVADIPLGGAWGTDGYIYFAPTNVGGIWRVPEGGGPTTEVTRKDPAAGEISHRWPHVIAGTSALLFGMWTGPGDDEHARRDADDRRGRSSCPGQGRRGAPLCHEARHAALLAPWSALCRALASGPEGPRPGRPGGDARAHHRPRRKRGQLRRVHGRHARLRRGWTDPQRSAAGVDRPLWEDRDAAAARAQLCEREDLGRRQARDRGDRGRHGRSLDVRLRPQDADADRRERRQQPGAGLDGRRRARRLPGDAQGASQSLLARGRRFR